MTASQPTLLKIMVPPIARPGRVHICQQTLVNVPFAHLICRNLFVVASLLYPLTYSVLFTYYSVCRNRLDKSDAMG